MDMQRLSQALKAAHAAGDTAAATKLAQEIRNLQQPTQNQNQQQRQRQRSKVPLRNKHDQRTSSAVHVNNPENH